MKKVEFVHFNSIEGVQIINSERIKNLQALDQGFFGSVYLGELIEEDLVRRVVVKSAKNDDVSMEEEIKTMKKINDHDFILELIGVCYNLDGIYLYIKSKSYQIKSISYILYFIYEIKFFLRSTY